MPTKPARVLARAAAKPLATRSTRGDVMKVGDLVKFGDHMHMPGCLGIIVALNGEAFDVQWLDDFSRKAPNVNEREISTELSGFLEIVSEAQNSYERKTK